MDVCVGVFGRLTNSHGRLVMFKKYMSATAKILCLGILAAPLGCIGSTRNAIPAYRLPQQFEAPSHQSLQAINFALLSKDQNVEYRLGAGDVIGVLVQGIVPPGVNTIPPVIQGSATLNREYYPPTGVLQGPAIGLPSNVNADGRLALPLVNPVLVQGMTLQEATEAVSRAYIDEQLVKEGRDRVTLTLLKTRVNRIVVLREDASVETAAVIGRNQSVINKRGSGFAVDLPFNESDVLHALISSGGLPGIDAYNEVWVLRQSTMGAETLQQAKFLADAGETPENIVANLVPDEQVKQQIVRIPLKICPVNHFRSLRTISPWKTETLSTSTRAALNTSTPAVCFPELKYRYLVMKTWMFSKPLH